ncbi:MAG: GNAT family N-acetyltransferase [Candidatus Helarchaeota archaeon]
MSFSVEDRIRRLLIRIASITKSPNPQVKLSPSAAELLEIQDGTISSNYGYIDIKKETALQGYFINVSPDLTHSMKIFEGDYIECFRIEDTLQLIPIPFQNLTDYFFKTTGVTHPRIILLSSHAEFEPFTREIATLVYQKLREVKIPVLRIEIRKHYLNFHKKKGITKKIDITISRYEVDITRNLNGPQIIANKLTNRNGSYRIIADLYFQLLKRYLPIKDIGIVVDIHGIATQSSKGILHPKLIVGDALLFDSFIEHFVKTLRKGCTLPISDPWFVYSPKWGAVEYSLQLVKQMKNIPILVEIRRDLRDNRQTREYLSNLLAQGLRDLVHQLPSNKFDTSAITYRPFRRRDFRQIRFVYMEAFHDLFGTEVITHAETFITLFKRALKEGTAGEMFVAEENKRIVGFAVIHNESTGEWKFGPIAVLSTKQHLGIGSKLLQICIDYAKTNNVKEFYLKVHKSNKTAIQLYHKFGFEVIASVPSDISGISFLYMRKNLPGVLCK